MPILKLPGGSVRDEIRQPLFDTIDIVAGEAAEGVRDFFSDVQSKGKSLTNLRQNNLLETAVSFRIVGIAIDAQNDVVANIRVLPIIQESSALELRVGEKLYWEGPLRFACGRLYEELAGGAQIYQQFGFPAVQGVSLQGRHVVDINPLQSFRIKWTVEGLSATEKTDASPDTDSKVRFVCSLKGILRRPVQ